MTYVLPIVSAAAVNMPPVIVEIDNAPNFRRAKRTALFIARRQMGILAPIVFDREAFEAAQKRVQVGPTDHEAAAMCFSWAVEEARKRVRVNLNGHSPMCFDCRYYRN